MERHSPVNLTQATIAVVILTAVLIAVAYFSQTTQPAEVMSEEVADEMIIDSKSAEYEPLPETVQAIPIVEPAVGENTIEVTYTDNGFEPSDVRITAGQTVVFTNNSTHTLRVQVAGEARYTLTSQECSADVFDSCEAIEPQSTWEFTFMSEGIWPYWNTEQKAAKGVVRVL